MTRPTIDDSFPFALAHAVQEFPDAIALMQGGQRLSYARLDAATRDWVARLDAAGIPDTGVVALRLAPSLHTLLLLLALLRSGRIVLPLNPRFPDAYVCKVLADAGCDTLVSDTCLESLEGVRQIALADFTTASSAHTTSSQSRLDGDAPAVLVLTSGSSAAPKAAALSLRNLQSAATASNANIPLVPGDGWLLSLPLFHVAGLGVVFRCMQAGASVVLPEPGVSLRDALANPAVTHASLVATQLYRLLRDNGGAQLLRSKKALLCGGSAFPPSLLDAAAEASLPLHLSFGMTETAAQICATRAGESRDAWHSAGHPLTPGTVRISASGEIQVRGDSLSIGYWRQGRLEPLQRDEGWFSTGDLGAWDAQGRLMVLGRIGNRFNVGGENVQPEEIERALLALDGVLRARVVALPDPEYVQVPVAFVDVAHARDLLPQLQQTLPRHALPRHILPWPAHLEREGEKLSRQALEAEALRVTRIPTA